MQRARPGRAHRDRQPARRDGAHLRVRQPHRRRGSRAVVLRPRRVRALRAGHEDDRRRPGAAGPHLRRLRDGRERGRIPRPAAPGSRSSWSAAVPTGVEIAGQIAELSRSGLSGNFRRIDPADATVVLVDGGKEILAAFGDRLSEKAARQLRHLGVTIRTGTVVTGVDAFGVDVRTADGSSERLVARTKIWAAGVQASPLAGLLAEASGATCDRAGRIAVLEDCTLPGHPEVFAIGDMMALRRPPRGRRGRHAVGDPRRQHDQAPAPRQGGGDVHLPRPRQHGDHLALPRRGELQGPPAVRVPRLVDVALRAHHLPDRLQEPPRGDVPLGRDLPGRAAAPSGRSRCARSSAGSPSSRAAATSSPDTSSPRSDATAPDEG